MIKRESIFLFTVLALVAFTSTSADTTEKSGFKPTYKDIESLCSQVTDVRKKWHCQDAIAARNGLPADDSPSGKGWWHLSIKTDPIDDKRSVTAGLFANLMSADPPMPPVFLEASCETGDKLGLTVFIDWGVDLKSDTEWGKQLAESRSAISGDALPDIDAYNQLPFDVIDVIQRFGKAKAVMVPWLMSKPVKMLTYPFAPGEFLDAMAKEDRFVARVAKPDGGQLTAVFDTIGISEVIKGLHQACTW